MLLIQNTSYIWFLQRFFIVKNVFNSVLIIIFSNLFPRTTINGIPPGYQVLTGLGMFYLSITLLDGHNFPNPCFMLITKIIKE